MTGLLLFAVVALVAFISKALKSSSSSRSKQIRDQTTWRFQQARERFDALRQFQPQPRQQSQPPAPPPQSGPQPGPQPFHQQFLQQTRPQPGPSPYGPPGGPAAPAQPWQAAWAPVEAAVDAAIDVTDLPDDPHVRQFLPDPDLSGESAEPAEPAELAESADPATSVLSAPTPARDIGSAALESTLDSSIESSLFGAPSESALTTTTLSTSLGGQAVTLPSEIETRVLALLTDGHDVAAVRLICDELNCGLLDAMRTMDELQRRSRADRLN
jgi:hypothetical protein